MAKRIIKLLISLIYFIITYIPNLFIYKSKFVILYYHSVSIEDLPYFIEQLNFFVDNFHFVNLEKPNFIKSKINIAITFDDALTSVLYNAQPELVKREIPYTTFIPTGYLGRKADWAIDSAEKVVHEPVMTFDQLIQLDQNLCTLGSHTVNHKNLTKITYNEAKCEIQESKKELEKLFNKNIRLFSFPYGAYNLKLVELAKETGFTGIYTINNLFASTEVEEKLFDRIAVSPRDWKIELYLKIVGGYNWSGILQKRRYLKTEC